MRHSHLPEAAASDLARMRIDVRGAVQGIGYRPFVARLARDLCLHGCVRNAGDAVCIDVEGAPDALAELRTRLARDAPSRAHIVSVRARALPALGQRGFAIIDSAPGDGTSAAFDVPLDTVVCAACIAEIRDPCDRRHGHAFNHCNDCGPRWSVIEAFPYDRERTSLADFPLCAACQAEYGDAGDRRYHAQGITCRDCGPRLVLHDADGIALAVQDDAIASAVRHLRQGAIVAVKGMGGYQLWVRAADGHAVARLRARKHRPHKPFALMVPDVSHAEALCVVDDAARALVGSAAGPIVLMPRRADARLICTDVAPGIAELGVMLPSTPLHVLLLDLLGETVVATSGNRGGEPLCHVDEDARERLRDIADVFLVHDRRIVHPLDDSVARIVRGRPQVLRLARGYAPFGFVLPRPVDVHVAHGADLKHALAVAQGDRALLGPHIGDLDDRVTLAASERIRAELTALATRPVRRAVCDRHPHYLSRLGAGSAALEVGHHRAHALAALADHGGSLPLPCVALTWDGSGHGDDGTAWGAECLRLDTRGRAQRLGSFLTCALVGGDAAVRDPRRLAHALRHAAGAALNTDVEHAAWTRMLEQRVHTPSASSVGRLFDGVATIIDEHYGRFTPPSFEGQCALRLEALARSADGAAVTPYAMPFVIDADDIDRLDWRPLIVAILDDLACAVAAERIATRFHAALIDAACAQVDRVAPGLPVVLAGGAWQNRLLIEAVSSRLEQAGRAVFWPERIPINDGGIAAGQLVAASLEAA